MKKVYRQLMCLLCSLILIALNITVFAVKSIEDIPVDAPNENLSAVYGTVLNDYINSIGVISDEHPRGFIKADTDAPNGLIYADIMNFDNSDKPYLVLFLADGKNKAISCHIWTYNDTSGRTEKVAEIVKPYNDLAAASGSFSIGWNNEKRYIIFTEFQGELTLDKQFFTVINGEAFKYVEDPDAVNEAPVIRFNTKGLKSEVDISNFNDALSKFFDKLKNAAAESVTYRNITDDLSKDDTEAMEKTISYASEIGNFNILDYSTIEDYEEALTSKHNGNKFYLISEVYGLGSEIYYVRFSTNASFYNYALLRHTDRDEKYQILKVRLDCIPLSDRELEQLEADYSKSTLLYKKAKSYGLPQITNPPIKITDGSIINLPKIISLPKVFNKETRKTAVYTGAAITVLLITGLWVYMYGSDDD